MRRLRFIPALLAIFLTACSENIIEHSPDRESDVFGTVSIALSANMDNEVVGTRADADEPVLDDFRVAIYKSENQMRLIWSLVIFVFLVMAFVCIGRLRLWRGSMTYTIAVTFFGFLPSRPVIVISMSFLW